MSSRLIFDQKQRIADWVAAHNNNAAAWVGAYAMGVERNGVITAGIVIENFNGANAVVHIAVDKPGKDMVALFKAFGDYAFRQCQLKRVTGFVPSTRPDILKFDLHLGFEQEFVMTDAAPDGDLHVLVLRADNYLNSRNATWLKVKTDDLATI